MSDELRPRLANDQMDTEAEKVRLERAAKVAALAYQRSQRSFIVAFVALILSIASIVQSHL